MPRAVHRGEHSRVLFKLHSRVLFRGATSPPGGRPLWDSDRATGPAGHSSSGYDEVPLAAPPPGYKWAQRTASWLQSNSGGIRLLAMLPPNVWLKGRFARSIVAAPPTSPNHPRHR